ncbi:MAG: 30S ribosomal protein S6 [Oscillospiraceae bacterium]|jgi:small subunit ribosomal protein S6|nr:30S ribosomal protein S6 [Oscillospiraceae bacterium]
MAKVTEKYEAVVAFTLKNGEDGVTALKDKFKALTEANATNVSVEEWGKRVLAYPVNYEKEGFYVLYKFDSVPDFPKEFERVINITDGVLRSLVVLRKE